MNTINLVGRITKDLELRQTTNKCVCEFTLAANRNFKNAHGEFEADFITCQIWGSQAMNLTKYQGKGSLIGATGSLRTDTYKDKEGNNRYRTYVLVSNVEYLGTKKEENAQNNQNIAQNEEVDPFIQMGMEVNIDDYLD